MSSTNGHPAAEFRILGPIEAVVGGEPVDLGPPKRRLVLALLALECDRPVAVDRLVELSWETPPPAARRVIFAHIAKLRKALAGVHIVSTPPGYALRVDPESVDVHRFRRLLAHAAADRDPGQRSALLDEALELWRGPPLDGLTGGPAERLCHGLEEQRLSALEDHAEARLATGHHAVLVGELSGHLFRHPHRERLAACLMLALYRCDNTAAALQVYRRTTAALGAELGLDPSHTLTSVHEAILRRDPAVAAPPIVSPARPPAEVHRTPLEAGPAQLPAAVFGFAGRRAELAQLDRLLTETGAEPGAVRIAAICGPAGIGKTALALHWSHRVADRFPGGQLYVNLHGSGTGAAQLSPPGVLRGLLDSLGVPGQRVPAGVEAQAALYRSLLAGRRVLVVLDDARDTDQVRHLLPGTPGCLVVLTSRDPLAGLVAVEGAHPVLPDALTTGEARDLLAGRLGLRRVGAEPAAAEEIIAYCAHLPLALAVVAGRAATSPGRSLAAMAAEMRAEFGHLGHPGGDSAGRRHAALSWSYRRLGVESARPDGRPSLIPGHDGGRPVLASLTTIAPLRQARGA